MPQSATSQHAMERVLRSVFRQLRVGRRLLDENDGQRFCASRTSRVASLLSITSVVM